MDPACGSAVKGCATETLRMNSPPPEAEWAARSRNSGVTVFSQCSLTIDDCSLGIDQRSLGKLDEDSGFAGPVEDRLKESGFQ